MVDRNLLREFNVDNAELEAVMQASFEALEDVINAEAQTYDINDILTGTVVRVDDEEVMVDIGYKSEGVIQRDEWEEGDILPKIGSSIASIENTLGDHRTRTVL